MDKTLLAILLVTLLSFAVNCSGQKSDLEGRIIGGDVISAYYIPYQVSLRRRTSNRAAYAHTCGGSLLDERTILTAAHCVNNRLPENFLVVAGTELRAGIDGIVTRVERIVQHEQYNSSITDNDVALVFVSPPFPLSTNLKIASIELATEQPAAGTVATVSGWGATAEGGFSSAQLQRVQVPLVANDVCQAAYDWRPITDGMLCAGAPDGGKDACQGDSGGPLVANNKLLGVVSWGEGCARADYPGVYAAVPHFIDWIAQQRAANP